MPIIAKETGSNFEPCPAGLHQAVCVDVVDLGEVKVTYAGKEKVQPKVYIVWQIDEEIPSRPGEYFTVRRRYTLSLSDKASLRRDLETWRGKAFTPEQLKGFDLEALLGANCQISVAHDTRDGSTYANVTAVVPLGKGMAKLTAQNYTRVKDREQKNNSGPSDADEHGVSEDDIVPF